jgi:acyl carrier protein
VEPRSIPKTTSGKIQRRACREGFLANRLAAVFRWEVPRDQKSREQIESWLIAQLALSSGTDPRTLDPRAPFSNYSLDSNQLVQLSGELERWLGRSVSPMLVYEYPSIDTLARHLSGETIAPTRSPERSRHQRQPG